MRPHKSPITFFSLPAEIRIPIYEYALCQIEKVAARPLGREWDLVGRLEGLQNHLSPSLLRTCQQVRREATPILYNGNTFSMDYPEHNLEWLDQIGPTNVKHIKRLSLTVFGEYYPNTDPLRKKKKPQCWYLLLKRLGREVTDLWYLHMYWDAGMDYARFGAGRDLYFVRALATIKPKEEMVIAGYFAIPWPEYLEEKVGKIVVVDSKRFDTEGSEAEGPDGHGPDDVAFSFFQAGTEHLIP